ncbi:leucine-zipper of insertion element IS481 [Brevibacterium sandarakinum]|uniref:Leucine-zipper of insertion element IS481 n=1 Tax=Brevibacterium sandarakinum TaxID=629680 RepID=A0A1H1NU40_BRESA|nr:leucine-zipper of insertion element IS481 [Brevibacterium sandarakinum]
MTHANAALSFEGRRRLIERCKTRPIAHVAAEMGISRACASKWVNRWRTHGEIGLLDEPWSDPMPRGRGAGVAVQQQQNGRAVAAVADEQLQSAGIDHFRAEVFEHTFSLLCGNPMHKGP